MRVGVGEGRGGEGGGGGGFKSVLKGGVSLVKLRGVVTNVLDIEILGGEAGELGGEASPPPPCR